MNEEKEKNLEKLEEELTEVRDALFDQFQEIWELQCMIAEMLDKAPAKSVRVRREE